MAGQAPDAAGPDLGSLIDSSFVDDDPIDQEAELAADDVTGEDPEQEADEPAKEQAANVEQRIKLKIKNAEGEEVEEEFSTEDLAKGVMMDRDYRHKTMALAERERQATQIVQQQIGKAQQAQMASVEENAAIVEGLLGAFTDDRLAALKEQDRGAWAEAMERKASLNSARQHLNQKAQALQQEQAQMMQAQRQEQARQTWTVLNSSGITEKDVSKAFAAHKKFYGDLGQVDYDSILDPVSVMTINDAVKYRELVAAKPELTKRVQEAPKMPKRNAPTATNERQNTALKAKFSRKAGGASLRDLGDFIAANS